MRAFVGALFASVGLLLLTACGGGGSATTSNAVPQLPPGNGSGSVAPSTPGGSTGTTATVIFKMNWSSGAVSITNSTTRRAAGLAPTARSASVTVNTSVAQYLNNPTSTLSFSAPTGLDTFFIKIYDEQNGQGNVIAQAAMTQTVDSSGTGNVISSTVNGVIASVVLSVLGTANAGNPSTVNLGVAIKDADGNVIVGGDFGTPITLTSSSSAAPLSQSILQAPQGNFVTINYTGAPLLAATITATANGITPSTTTFSPNPTEYENPTTGGKPQWITAGADGNLYFTESNNKIGKMTTLGQSVADYIIPTANANAQGIISASDGRLWFTEFGSSKIGAMTTVGAFTEYGTLFGSDGPQLLVDRGDGNVWYAGLTGNHIGYQGITTGLAGETTSPTASSQPYSIVNGPDNNLYYTESASGVDKIGRIDNLFGTITQISLTSGTHPLQIVRGPDGNLWFTENGTNKIGVLNPACFCIYAEYPTLTPNSQPTGIVVGTDGALWFTETGLDRIGRVTTTGVMTEYRASGTGLGMQGIAVAPDGALWIAEPGTGSNSPHVGHFVP